MLNKVITSLCCNK